MANLASKAVPCLPRWLVPAVTMLIAFSAPLRAEEVTQQFRNLTVNANLELAEGKDFSDGVVLMLHGLMAHNRMEIMRTFQDVFKDNGQSSLAINLSLGLNNRHGSYDCALPHRHRLSDAPDELEAWVGWLKTKGANRITLIGHSIGANQVLVFAAERDDPAITGVILLAPSTGSYERVSARYETRYKKKLADELARAQSLIAAGKGDELMEKVDFLYCPAATVTPTAFYEYYHDHRFGNVPSFLQRLKKPTLVIAAGMDELQPDVAKRVAPFVDGKKIHLVVIEGSGHFFRDLFTDDAVEAAVAFMAASK